MFGLTHFLIYSFPFLHLSPSSLYYSHFNLSKSYFGIQSFLLMSFGSLNWEFTKFTLDSGINFGFLLI